MREPQPKTLGKTTQDTPTNANLNADMREPETTTSTSPTSRTGYADDLKRLQGTQLKRNVNADERELERQHARTGTEKPTTVKTNTRHADKNNRDHKRPQTLTPNTPMTANQNREHRRQQKPTQDTPTNVNSNADMREPQPKTIGKTTKDTPTNANLNADMHEPETTTSTSPTSRTGYSDDLKRLQGTQLKRNVNADERELERQHARTGNNDEYITDEQNRKRRRP